MGYAMDGGTLDVLTRGAFRLVRRGRERPIDREDDWQDVGNCCDNAVGLVADQEGNAYLTSEDHDALFKVTAGGRVSVLAGRPFRRPGPPPAGQARPMALRGLAIDGDGTIFVSDFNNHRVCRLHADGVGFSVVTGTRRGWVDGPRESARLRRPERLVADGRGGLILQEEHPWLRGIDASGSVRTMSQGADMTPGWGGGYGRALGLAIGPAGQVAVTFEDMDGVAIVSPDGAVETWIVSASHRALKIRPGLPRSSEDWNGWAPQAVAFDRDGRLLVVDGKAHVIWRLSAEEAVEAVTGPYDKPFRQPAMPHLAVGPDDTLYVSAPEQRAILAVSPDGRVRPHVEGLRRPGPMAIDPAGRLVYIDHERRVARVAPDGQVEVLWRAPADIAPDGEGQRAVLERPGRLAMAPNGDVFVLERGAHRIRRVTPSGVVTTLVRGADAWPGAIPGGADLVDIAVDGDGHLVAIDDLAGKIYRFAHGDAREVATYAAFEPDSPEQVSLVLRVAPDGAFLVADARRHRVYRVVPGGLTELIAGSVQGTWDGARHDARFSGLHDMAIAPNGDLYVADRHRVARIVPGGEVLTLVGAPLGWVGPMYRRNFETRVLALTPDGRLLAIPGAASTVYGFGYGFEGALLTFAPEQPSRVWPSRDALAQMLQAEHLSPSTEPPPTEHNMVSNHITPFTSQWEDLVGEYLYEVSPGEADDYLRLRTSRWRVQCAKVALTIGTAAHPPASKPSWNDDPAAAIAGLGTSQVRLLTLDLDLAAPETSTVTLDLESGSRLLVSNSDPFRPLRLSSPQDTLVRRPGDERIASWDALLGRTIDRVSFEDGTPTWHGDGWTAAFGAAEGVEPPGLVVVTGETRASTIAEALSGRRIINLHAALEKAMGEDTVNARVVFTLDNGLVVSFGSAADPLPVFLMPVPFTYRTWVALRMEE
jgi:glucose/arabinose dehydrogenase